MTSFKEGSVRGKYRYLPSLGENEGMMHDRSKIGSKIQKLVSSDTTLNADGWSVPLTVQTFDYRIHELPGGLEA